MAKNFPKLVTDTKPHIPKDQAQSIPSKINTYLHTEATTYTHKGVEYSNC